MSESLGELLRRSADAAPEPRVDVGELVIEAGKRQRRRRFAVVAGAAGLVGAVVVGTVAIQSGHPRALEPAPSPSPSVVDPATDTTRPLVYAEGSMVHVGDRSIAANARVMFVDATDDGVVFITDRDGRMWFDDGSTTESIGLLSEHHVGMYDVFTSDPGSIVVWPDGTGQPGMGEAEEFVVYDTSRREEVGRVPYDGRHSRPLYVDTAHVFFNPDSNRPGCWINDVQTCSNRHLFRYDIASGRTQNISHRTFETELGAQHRMLVTVEPSNGSQATIEAGASFRQQGRRLVPTDSNGDDTVVTGPDGDPVRLWLPAGYAAARDNIRVVQWLDDDRLVLAVDQDSDETGFGDTYRARLVDLLVCRLPDGVCQVAVRVSAVPYLSPGR